MIKICRFSFVYSIYTYIDIAAAAGLLAGWLLRSTPPLLFLNPTTNLPCDVPSSYPDSQA